MRWRGVGCALTFAVAGSAGAAPHGPAVFDTVGVNTHVYALGTAYGNLPAVLAALEYLGVRHVRDNPPAKPRPERYLALVKAGIGLDLVARSNAEPPLPLFDVLAPGLDVIEGPNEVNAHPDSLLYHGASGFAAAAALQAKLYGAVRADAKLRGVPVAMFSAVYHGKTDLPPYAGVAKADLANVHAYPPGAAAPPADYLPAALTRWSAAVPGGPVLVTEFGYFTWGAAPHGAGVNTDVQAKWTLDALADNFFNMGIRRQYIYELVDQVADDVMPNKENHFGLFANDWKPKPAAVAIHDLREILGTAGYGYDDVGISGLPPRGFGGVLSNGTQVFVLLWRENEIWDARKDAEVSSPPVAVTVRFPGEPALAVFDPLRGAAPIRSLSGGEITVPLADDLLVVRAG